MEINDIINGLNCNNGTNNNNCGTNNNNCGCGGNGGFGNCGFGNCGGFGGGFGG